MRSASWYCGGELEHAVHTRTRDHDRRGGGASSGAVDPRRHCREPAPSARTHAERRVRLTRPEPRRLAHGTDAKPNRSKSRSNVNAVTMPSRRITAKLMASVSEKSLSS